MNKTQKVTVLAMAVVAAVMFAGQIAMSSNAANAVGDAAAQASKLGEAELIKQLGDDAAWERGIQRMWDINRFKEPPVTVGEAPIQFTPTAREIDTSLVSVSGHAMSAQEYDYDKRQVDVLEEIERNTRKTANQEVLN